MEISGRAVLLLGVILALGWLCPAAGQNTFTLQMPIRPADLGANAFGLNPFGTHIGNHGIDGHPGWDIEYRIGASAYVAADGVVQSVSVESQSGRSTVQVQHGPRFRTDYTNLVEVDAAIRIGANVKTGQRLGTPGTSTQTVGATTQTWAMIHFQLDDFTVNYGLSNGFAVSPEAHLDTTGRALFGLIWSQAGYPQEICEPFPSNPRNVTFPFTRTWRRQSGSLAVRIDFTCMGPLSPIYGYSLYDATGTAFERGTLEPQSVRPEFTIFDLLPEGSNLRRRGLLRILNDTMQIDWSGVGAERPSDLGAASTYRTEGYPLSVTSGASYAAGKIAPDSIAVGFGAGVGVETTAAQSLPLPSTLAGTRAIVWDSAGVMRDAALFFVSPGQVGFLVPAETAPGRATTLVTSPNGPVYSTISEVERVVPALFSASASGRGPAAAIVQRVRADGSQSIEPVARFDAAQAQWVALPINFGPESDELYLVLYGTGIRLRNALSDVTVRIDGTSVSATYAGPHGGSPGLDQINVLLSRALAGKGSIDVSVIVEVAASNTVAVSFQ
jgi:uncharacterized protein (TIGR03437 family)